MSFLHVESQNETIFTHPSGHSHLSGLPRRGLQRTGFQWMGLLPQVWGEVLAGRVGSDASRGTCRPLKGFAFY